MRIIFWLIIVIALPGFAQTHDVSSVPNTKLVDGSYVSDPDHILKPETIVAINGKLNSLEDSTTAQVAVVMLKSIGGNDVFTFAEELFNKWGIGRSENDNGLLILYVEDQRVIRFHTGDGMEAILPDARCKQIQRDYMVPRFKEGDVDAGILEGLDAVVRAIENPNYADEVVAAEGSAELNYNGFMLAYFIFYGAFFLVTWFVKASNFKFADSPGRHRDTFPAQSLSKRGWLITFGLVPTLIVLLFAISGHKDAVVFCVFILYLYFIGTLIARLVRLNRVIRSLLKEQKYFDVTELIKDGRVYWFLVALLFPIPFFIYFFVHLYRQRYYRNYPRNCNACGGRMSKLGEREDDEFLSEAARMEEQLKAGDYDVWKCKSCQATEYWFYKNAWSKYESCPKCKTLAFYTKSTRTVESATYSSSGRGEKIMSCKFCQYNKTETYSIPMLTRSSDSSSGSSFSSSSGGSWGGGSSSGGGASSSW